MWPSRRESVSQSVSLQPHEGCWHRVKVVHRPLYLSRAGHTQEPTDQWAVQAVSYAALVKRVQLLKDGELGHVDSRELSLRGWGLKVRPADSDSVHRLELSLIHI